MQKKKDYIQINRKENTFPIENGQRQWAGIHQRTHPNDQ